MAVDPHGRRWKSFAKCLAAFVAVLLAVTACPSSGGPRVVVENRTTVPIGIHGNRLPAGNMADHWIRPGGWAKASSDLVGSGLDGKRLVEPNEVWAAVFLAADRAPDNTRIVVTAVTETGEPVFQRIYTVKELENPNLRIVVTDERPLPWIAELTSTPAK